MIPASVATVERNTYPAGSITLAPAIQQMFTLSAADRTNGAGIGYQVYYRSGSVVYEFMGQDQNQLEFMVLVLADNAPTGVLPTADDIWGVGYTMSPFIAPLMTRFTQCGKMLINVSAHVDIGTLNFEVPLSSSQVHFDGTGGDTGAIGQITEHDLIFVTYGEADGSLLDINAQNVNTLNFLLPVVPIPA